MSQVPAPDAAEGLIQYGLYVVSAFFVALAGLFGWLQTKGKSKPDPEPAKTANSVTEASLLSGITHDMVMRDNTQALEANTREKGELRRDLRDNTDANEKLRRSIESLEERLRRYDRG